MHLRPGVAEEEIIRHCKTGSLKYQEMLYKLFYGYAMGISLRYCFSREDAVEVVNDAFIKVFNAISSYATDKPFKPWLRSIIINTAIDRRRKELKFQFNTDLENAEALSYTVTAIDNLNAQDILKLMRQLPAVQITVFNLYEIDGYNHDEIAQILGLSPSSSRVYLTRAKEKLRNILNKEQQNHG
ncbi:MAG: polymerase subunit sigma-70 [Mucilaginibacter sp.]|nr:polymerase subunit sigma-70 [Mucilaginibacter sp.]